MNTVYIKSNDRWLNAFTYSINMTKEEVMQYMQAFYEFKDKEICICGSGEYPPTWLEVEV